MKPFSPDKACSLNAAGYPDGVRWCEGMRSALAGVPENYDGTGLSFSRGWFSGEIELRVVGVTYARRAGARLPLLLNFCPWCGACIRFDGE